MTETLLLRVAAAWPLPGLGLLVLPLADAPALRAYPLHTALAVVARLPDGRQLLATATVEEIAHAGTLTYGLLLEFTEDVRILPDTEIWLAQQAAML